MVNRNPHNVVEQSLVRTRSVCVNIEGRRVLNAVDLHVAPGEIVGLIGPNGAGKTTLVRVLSGVQPIDHGCVWVCGVDMASLPRRQLARTIAVVPQEPSFAFQFSVLEVVLMGRHPHLGGTAFESSDDIEQAHDAMKRCGVAHLASRSINALSSGERQRVVFARALAQRPRLLILDEPASFLDIKHQVGLYDRLRLLSSEQGVGVLTILHDLNLAAEYCDRMYLLRDGQVCADGATQDVLTYKNLKAAFDTELYVDLNDLTGRLIVAPLSARAVERLGVPAGPLTLVTPNVAPVAPAAAPDDTKP